MADTSDEYFTMQGFGDPVSASGQGEKAGSQASSSNDCSSSLVGNLATGEYTITGRKLSDKTSSLQKRRQKSNKRTAELSSEELEERKKKRRLYMKNYRAKQSKEATQARLQHLRQSAAERRDTESEQARKARLQQMRQHAAETRDSESELAKEACLQQVRQHAAETRDSESELAKEARLQQMRQHAAETRDSESELAKEARLQQARQHGSVFTYTFSPTDRDHHDVDMIIQRLRRVDPLARLPNSVLQELACVGYYEDLERGVTLFRQGDIGTSWYTVLAGSLDIKLHDQNESSEKGPVTLCSLGVGSTFGESVLNDMPREGTVVTKSTCELLRVEQQDFRIIWEKHKDFLEDIVRNAELKHALSSGSVKSPPPVQSPPPYTSLRNQMSEIPSLATPVLDSPTPPIARAGWTLRTLLLAEADDGILCDHKICGRIHKRCATGTDLVDWLLSIAIGTNIHSRQQAVNMWQSLQEEGVIAHVTGDHVFKDANLLYRFRQDTGDADLTQLPTADEIAKAEDQLNASIVTLLQRAPDASLRMILRKPSDERTPEDLETIYEELVHIKALAHLSNSVKRELAAVIVFEAHHHANTVLFNQGDEGRSWYIILRGSVDVVIHGKGTVTTLHEGDDFGKLALINDAPRAATIVLRENNCHFLRVDKEDFNRILRDVEANTVRLKEHGQIVLILEKNSSNHTYSHFKYTVMAGTPQKMLEHLLETRLDGRGGGVAGLPPSDLFLEDFLLTHIVFMPTHQLVTELSRHYRIDSSSQDREFLLACKRRVVQFVHCWVLTIRNPIFEDPNSVAFLQELASEVEADCNQWSSLQEEASLMHHVMSQLKRYQEDLKLHDSQKWKLPPGGQAVCLFSDSNEGGPTVIKADDDIIFRVYCADHTYCTLRTKVGAKAKDIIHLAAEKLKLKQNDNVLVEVRSSGERIKFQDSDVGIPTALTLNGRIFVSPKDHLDALTCLPEQVNPREENDKVKDLELFSTKELAYHLTLFDWNLFWCVHEYELLYHTFGKHQFGKITSNLDVFIRRHNELQYWVVTELCLTSSLSKRVAILRKLIKLAAYCKEYQNLNAFCAIVMGLGNMAVSRLSLTWEKLPSKFRKLFTEFESFIDPTRNHRAYRVNVTKLTPPVVPFMPLLIKDMTFIHEGNKTCLEGLVNFEKMHMLAQTMRTMRYCRSRNLILEPPSPKSEADIQSYISNLRTIDNQRLLTSLSQKLEPRRS